MQLSALWCCACWGVTPCPGEQATDEYAVKAAFLYNFALFVHWPENTFHAPGERFTICILGKDPFGHTLEDMVAGKTREGRGFRIARITDPAQSSGCQILFFALTYRMAASTLAEVQRGTLTVGETSGFAASGGIVNFTLDNGRVRFQINRHAAERAGVEISSRLLNLADVIDK